MLRTLAFVALVAGVTTYTVFRAFYGSLPPLPRTITPSVFLLAVAELFLAPSVRARLEGRPRTKPILPIGVARTAAFAKASSAIGALVAGCLLGVGAYALSRWDVRAARTDGIRAAAGIAAALLLVVAALRLENVCRVPKPPDGPPPGEPGP
ncbi:MAG: hypothetical protein QOE45_1619 [Frankiaceae bacterium]|jgi:hypothetical protein|nr:hypothetical protein [Frankiaceae bacterium]